MCACASVTVSFCHRVEKWLEDEPERKRKKREEKRKRLLQKKVPPKHFFNDQVYMQQLRANEEDMDGALKQGTHELMTTYSYQCTLIDPCFMLTRTYSGHEVQYTCIVCSI